MSRTWSVGASVRTRSRENSSAPGQSPGNLSKLVRRPPLGLMHLNERLKLNVERSRILHQVDLKFEGAAQLVDVATVVRALVPAQACEVRPETVRHVKRSVRAALSVLDELANVRDPHGGSAHGIDERASRLNKDRRGPDRSRSSPKRCLITSANASAATSIRTTGSTRATVESDPTNFATRVLISGSRAFDVEGRSRPAHRQRGSLR